MKKLQQSILLNYEINLHLCLSLFSEMFSFKNARSFLFSKLSLFFLNSVLSTPAAQSTVYSVWFISAAAAEHRMLFV